MAEENTTREVFTRIYEQHAWPGESRSGPGSSVTHARPYTRVLSDVLAELNAKSVLDLGCGDWNFSQHVDWTGVDYTGVDIVPDLIDSLQEQFGQPNVRFTCGNILEMDLPRADLVISKDVLQHLSHEQVQVFLARLAGFPNALLTNDRWHYPRRTWRNLWRRQPIGVVNEDVEPGGWRPLRLREPPYRLSAEQRGQYTVCEGERVWIKEVLLWRAPE